MKEDDIILEHIYGNAVYQKRLLSVACLVWGLLDIFSLSLGLLELKPLVDVFDASGNVIYEGPLQYQFCNSNSSFSIKSYSENSLVVYFGIYCNKYLVAMIGSTNFLGVLIGTLISPFIVDHFGRRRPIIIAVLSYSLLLILSTFSPNITVMLIFIFLCGFTNLISHIAIFLLINEVTRKEKRAQYSALMFNSFALFGIIFVWEFYYISYWKYVFYLTSFLSFLLFLLALMIVKESPRFLLLKKDRKFREKMLSRIFNYGKELEYYAEVIEDFKRRRFLGRMSLNLNDQGDAEATPYKVNLIDKTSDDSEICRVFLENLEKSKPDLRDNTLDEYCERESHKKSGLILLTNRNLNYVFLTMCFMWFCISGSYYGILIFAKDIKGNVYTVYTVMYILEIFSNIIATYMMEHPQLGRRKSLITLYLTAVVTIFIYLMIDISAYMNVFLTFLRFQIAVIYIIIYVYCIEFYPTDIRAKGLAFNAVFGRLSSIFVPFLVEVLGEMFFVYNIVIFGVSFSLSFLLKETYNTELEQYTKTN